jgi:omega-6 fatty acid desaturase (delta-12 desaturase)
VRRKLRNSIYLTNLSLVIFITTISYLIGFYQFLAIEIPMSIISSAAGVWLFYVQHQFDGVVWERTPNWNFDEVSVLGSSFYKLPKILQWFSGNIGFHHVHHLNPRIPNYYLEKCHQLHPELNAVKPLTIKESIKAFTLKLWDEENRRMVGYRYKSG